MLPPQFVRRLLAPLLGLALLVGAAGCGSQEQDSAGTPLDEPVKVEHRFGTTKVDEVPKRVVTVDMPWTDVMLSMGVEPVGHTVDPLMPKSGVPWQDLPADAKPLSTADGLPMEQIAKLSRT